MTDARRRRLVMVVGFVAAFAVLSLIFWLLGIDELLATLGAASLPGITLVALAALGWLLTWTLGLKVVLAALGVRIGFVEAVLVFSSAVFANNVTPFGQAGGEPVTALLISTVTDSEYETGLAAIVSVDALNLFPAIGFGLVGLAYYAATVAVTARIGAIALTLVAATVCLPVVGITLWRRRRRAEAGIARGFARLLGAISRVVPRYRPPKPEAVRRRVRSFVESLERIADDQRAIGVAFGCSALGWFGLICCLWLSFVALGETDPTLLAAAFVAVPVASVAAATPFPGGLGGMDAALIAVLAPLTGVPAATVGAAVVCYRVATYWLPTLLGGAATGAFGSTARW
ncbi:flippase-like domain-containing protein [Natrialbaceae archaeon GCM10025810]|uniref:flippase-like domain-containing protein n=1 Tax=Halovalidus salilacus TaxID=3075124 RepID=UPI003612ADC7